MMSTSLIQRALEAANREAEAVAQTTVLERVANSAFGSVGSRFGPCRQRVVAHDLPPALAESNSTGALPKFVALVEADGVTLRVVNDGKRDRVTAVVIKADDSIEWESKPLSSLVDLGRAINERIATVSKTA